MMAMSERRSKGVKIHPRRVKIDCFRMVNRKMMMQEMALKVGNEIFSRLFFKVM